MSSHTEVAISTSFGWSLRRSRAAVVIVAHKREGDPQLYDDFAADNPDELDEWFDDAGEGAVRPSVGAVGRGHREASVDLIETVQKSADRFLPNEN
jgi:hypothetical protein